MNSEEIERIIQKMPSCPGILGRERYFNSVVFIPLVENKGELCFVLEKRSPTIRQGGEISFPGGGFDSSLDKDYRDTAVRETVEELGVEEKQVVIYGRLDTMVSPIGSIIDVFLGTLKTDNPEGLPFNRDEVEKVLVIPVKTFIGTPPEIYKARIEIQPHYYDQEGRQVVLLPSKELGLPSRYLKPWGGREHTIYLYRAKGEVVWGITAELIRYVLSKMNGP